MTAKGPAASEYQKLEQKRESYLTRARKCAEVTIPSLLPDEGFSESSEFITPYQSVGSTGVRTISSKLLMALFPANIPFLRYRIDDYTVLKIADEKNTRGALEEALDSRARAIKIEQDNSKFRPVAFEALRQLVVTGNYLLYIPTDPKEAPRGYRLNHYVVRRDPSGTVLTIIIKESIAFSALPTDVQDSIRMSKKESDKQPEPSDEFDLYTHVSRRNDGKYEEYQEVEGVEIEGSRGTHKAENLPYIALRFVALDNEHYGRSFIEEFLGDLITLEGLSKAILEAAAMASRVVWLVNPSGTADVEELAEAENGDFVEGQDGEVVPLQMNKSVDLSTALQMHQMIVQRLQQAFMMASAAQRNAERVTAEEIRSITKELDDSLSGVYSLLAVDMQLPVAILYERRMEKTKKVPPLPKEIDVKPVIVTGVEALGRQKELQDLDMIIASVAQFVPQEQIASVVNLPEYFKRRASAIGIDTKGLIIDPTERNDNQQKQQLMEMLKEALPQLIQQGGGLMKQQAADQAPAAQPQ